MKNKLLALVAIFIVFLIAIFVIVKQKQPTTPQGLTKITVKNVPVNVRLAISDSERQKGLGGVESLAPDEGMLFVFPSKQPLSFWMKDTLIPLDMIWITNGKIANITRNVPIEAPGTPDQNLPVYYSGVEVDFVLEVNAGFSSTHNLAIGDQVDLSAVPKQ